MHNFYILWKLTSLLLIVYWSEEIRRVFSRASRTLWDATQVVTFLSVTKNVGKDRKGNAF